MKNNFNVLTYNDIYDQLKKKLDEFVLSFETLKKLLGAEDTCKMVIKEDRDQIFSIYYLKSNRAKLLRSKLANFAKFYALDLFPNKNFFKVSYSFQIKDNCIVVSFLEHDTKVRFEDIQSALNNKVIFNGIKENPGYREVFVELNSVEDIETFLTLLVEKEDWFMDVKHEKTK